jgi:hypothetical protein
MMPGDRTQIVQCHADDCADCAVAVITKLIDFRGYFKHLPEQVQWLGWIGGCDMRHDCRAVHVEITGQFPDLSSSLVFLQSI